jgi:hypothetical protein
MDQVLCRNHFHKIVQMQGRKYVVRKKSLASGYHPGNIRGKDD